MHVKFNTIRHVAISIIVLVLVPYVIYNTMLRETKCPIRTPRESLRVNQRSTPAITSLVDFPKIRQKQGESKKSSNERLHSISFYRLPDWISPVDVNKTLQQDCEYSNCLISNDSGHLKKHSAVIFALTEDIGKHPPLHPLERPRDQVWVFFYMESTLSVWRNRGFIPDSWRSTMNWSMTYRLDSDIVIPYGALKTRQQKLIRDYHKIYESKSKFAAYFVSHCNADSNRDEFVQDLRKHGIPVDIYGMCGEMGVQNRSYLIDRLNTDYKFFFAFENSLCPDYITEKFFSNFNLDVVLIVRGGTSYRRLLPNYSFIDASDFKSTHALAYYLMSVNSSETLYTHYLTSKDQYLSPNEPTGHMAYSYCKLCGMLNNKKVYTKIYEDVDDYIYRQDFTCQACSQTTKESDARLKNCVRVYYVLLLLICLAFFMRSNLNISKLYLTREGKTIIYKNNVI